MIIIGESLTSLVKNTIFSSINQGAGISTSPPLSSLIRFNLKLPLTSEVYTSLRTEAVTLDNLKVNTFYASMSATSSGRVLEFFNVDSVDTSPVYQVPTTDQITIKNSQFTTIKAAGDGSVGYFDVSTMRATVQNSGFTSVTQDASWLSIYGGVFKVVSMANLVIDTVTATTISAKTSPSYLGGGRFLYSDQDAAFYLKLNNFQITCQSSAYTATDSSAITTGTFS